MIDKLMNRALVDMPKEICSALETASDITLTRFEDKNILLTDEKLQSETGFRAFPNGSYLVSMVCPMKGITPEMIKWWFWWHAKDSKRYKVWFPSEHYAVSYKKENKAYFEKEKCPEFQNNTHYPVEKIGDMALPLRIDFVTPEEFGFSQEAMKENDIPIIVCGHVSALYGLVPHTEMAHIFKRTEDGLYMLSRFWIGETLKNKLLRKAILTEKTAKGMAEHCCLEYRNLCEILPMLYEEYAFKE